MMYLPMFMQIQAAKRARSARRVFFAGMAVLVVLESILMACAWW